MERPLEEDKRFGAMLEEGLRDMVRGQVVVNKDHALHRGWLYKQGAKRRNWKRRYFVLICGSMLYFATDNAPTPLGGMVVDATAGVELGDGLLSVTTPLSYTATGRDEPEEERGRAFRLQSCAGAPELQTQDLAAWRRALLAHMMGADSPVRSAGAESAWTVDALLALAERLRTPVVRAGDGVVCFANPAAATVALALLPPLPAARQRITVQGDTWDEGLEALRRTLAAVGGAEENFLAHIEAAHNLALAVRRQGAVPAAICLWEATLALFAPNHAHPHHYATLAKACGNAHLFWLESDGAPPEVAALVQRGSAYLASCLPHYRSEPMQYATTRINAALLHLKCSEVEAHVRSAMESLADPLVLTTLHDTQYMQHFADCARLVAQAARKLGLDLGTVAGAPVALKAAAEYCGDATVWKATE